MQKRFNLKATDKLGFLKAVLSGTQSLTAIAPEGGFVVFVLQGKEGNTYNVGGKDYNEQEYQQWKATHPHIVSMINFMEFAEGQAHDETPPEQVPVQASEVPKETRKSFWKRKPKDTAPPKQEPQDTPIVAITLRPYSEHLEFNNNMRKILNL